MSGILFTSLCQIIKWNESRSSGILRLCVRRSKISAEEEMDCVLSVCLSDKTEGVPVFEDILTVAVRDSEASAADRTDSA